PVFLGVLALIWIAQIGSLRRGDWLLVVPFLALAVSANRSVPPAWIGLAPILGRVRLPVRVSSLGGPVAWVLASILLVTPLFLRAEAEVDPERFPVEAAEHLTRSSVFHDDAAGG